MLLSSAVKMGCHETQLNVRCVPNFKIILIMSSDVVSGPCFWTLHCTAASYWCPEPSHLPFLAQPLRHPRVHPQARWCSSDLCRELDITRHARWHPPQERARVRFDRPWIIQLRSENVRLPVWYNWTDEWQKLGNFGNDELTLKVIDDEDGKTSGRNDKLRGQIGVKTIALKDGCTIGPPAERE